MFSSFPKNMKFSKFKFPFKFSGKYTKQSTSRLDSETDVSKEYKKAFRTNSYIEICHKVQSHIDLDSESSSSSLSICDHYIHQCNILLETQDETMASLANTFDIHCLFLEFFGAGSEAWAICERILHSIHQANANHQRIKKVINIDERVPKRGRRTMVYKELALYSSLPNPLTDFSQEKFPKMENQLKLLLKRLTTNRTRIKRKRKLIICLKKTIGCTLVASYTVLAIALLVLTFHGLVGLVAAPGLIACSLGLTKKAKVAQKGLKTSELKRVCVLLDVAAKGIYTLIKDFDTIGSLVGRLHEEVEFGRAIARNYVGKLKADVLDEVMKEFRVHEIRFIEQSEELKDHVYLGLLNINRSRRLLLKEIMPCSYELI